MLYWEAPSPRGYMGPQVIATRLISGEPQQVLFSIWDNKPGEDTWLPAIPDHENCNRNCNDCGVHVGDKVDDGSTGTQCKVFIPRYANQVLRMRVRRVEAEGSREMYGQTWTGGVWEVTVQDLGTGEVWMVGRQLLAEQTGGIVGTSAFNEHIGCTPCDAFDQSEVRGGPWVLDPPGTTLVGATSSVHVDARGRLHVPPPRGHLRRVRRGDVRVGAELGRAAGQRRVGQDAVQLRRRRWLRDAAARRVAAVEPASVAGAVAAADSAARRGGSRLRRAGEEPRQDLLDAVPVRRGGGGRRLVRVDVHVFTRILGQMGVPLLRRRRRRRRRQFQLEPLPRCLTRAGSHAATRAAAAAGAVTAAALAAGAVAAAALAAGAVAAAAPPEPSPPPPSPDAIPTTLRFSFTRIRGDDTALALGELRLYDAGGTLLTPTSYLHGEHGAGGVGPEKLFDFDTGTQWRDGVRRIGGHRRRVDTHGDRGARACSVRAHHVREEERTRPAGVDRRRAERLRRLLAAGLRGLHELRQRLPRAGFELRRILDRRRVGARRRSLVHAVAAAVACNPVAAIAAAAAACTPFAAVLAAAAAADADERNLLVRVQRRAWAVGRRHPAR